MVASKTVNHGPQNLQIISIAWCLYYRVFLLFKILHRCSFWFKNQLM